jgi:hypothetical protein
MENLKSTMKTRQAFRHPLREAPNLAWSTPIVLEQTLHAAAAAGLRVHPLPPCYDVDTGTDLERLGRELEGDGTTAQRTRAFLQRLRAGRPTGSPA